MSFSLQTLFAGVTFSAVFLGYCLSRNDGRLVKTDKPLDLAIMGEGYFQIRLENVNHTLYTRSGHFYIDAYGDLVAGTAAEKRALFPNVTFPQGVVPVFSANGCAQFYNAGQPELMTQMGTIQLATFSNPRGLKQVADDLYEPTDESGCPNLNQPGCNGVGLIRPGCLELPLFESWLADVKLPHMLMLGAALSACFFLLRELRAQRRELAKLQMLMSNPVQPGTC
jgi:flagellar basal body rod protein FlgG